MNPYSDEMMKVYYAFRALNGMDENCAEYIEFAPAITTATSAVGATTSVSPEKAVKYASELCEAVIKGLRDKAADTTQKMLVNAEPLSIVKEHIIPALDVVGKGFEENKIYLPQLLMSAEAAKRSFEQIKLSVLSSKKETADNSNSFTIVIATVKGDIHDIGKNIVKLLLENYGFRVIDLGRDVPPETVVDTAISEKARLVSLSALMTTTVPAMAETIELLRVKYPDCRVVVGGAVLNRDYAERIGADKYARDAMEAVRYAEELAKH